MFRVFLLGHEPRLLEDEGLCSRARRLKGFWCGGELKLHSFTRAQPRPR